MEVEPTDHPVTPSTLSNPTGTGERDTKRPRNVLQQWHQQVTAENDISTAPQHFSKEATAGKGRELYHKGAQDVTMKTNPALLVHLRQSTDHMVKYKTIYLGRRELRTQIVSAARAAHDSELGKRIERLHLTNNAWRDEVLNHGAHRRSIFLGKVVELLIPVSSAPRFAR